MINPNNQYQFFKDIKLTDDGYLIVSGSGGGSGSTENDFTVSGSFDALTESLTLNIQNQPDVVITGFTSDSGDETSLLLNTNPVIYADGKAGIVDPANQQGWYYKNDGSDKINWYFYGPNLIERENKSDLNNVWAVIDIKSNASLPFFNVYSKRENDGNDGGSWYRSRWNYDYTGAAPSVGTYFIYFGDSDPGYFAALPRLQYQFDSNFSVGPLQDSEELLTFTFATNSVAAADDVEILVSFVGYQTLIKHEFLLHAVPTSTGSNYTFQNGISESGGTVELGGPLTESTTIDSTGQEFKINTTGGGILHTFPSKGSVFNQFGNGLENSTLSGAIVRLEDNFGNRMSLDNDIYTSVSGSSTVKSNTYSILDTQDNPKLTINGGATIIGDDGIDYNYIYIHNGQFNTFEISADADNWNQAGMDYVSDYTVDWDGTTPDTKIPTKSYVDRSITIESTTTGEPSGSDQVVNVVSLTQAEYDAGTPNANTFYVITDA